MSQSERRADPAREPVRILPVPLAGSIIVLFAGHIRGLLTHWLRGRSVPCPGIDECPSANHGARTVWKGYAPAYLWSYERKAWIPQVLEVTEVLEEQLRGRDLIGEIWMLSRQDSGKKSSPVQGVPIERRCTHKEIDPFDITGPLLRFYHVSYLLLGVPNPTPPKLVLEALQLPGPRLPEPESPPEDARPTAEQMRQLREFANNTFGRRRASGDNSGPATNGKP